MTDPSLVYGAQHDLERLVRTHLFVISPNNSGSTFLRNVLALSRHTWNLRKEGQNTIGFQGFADNQLGAPLLFAATPRLQAAISEPDAVDWHGTRRAWYFQAYARDAEASVFVEKSPPFVFRVAELAEAFDDARFLFLVRNPYAVVEGIVRRSRGKWPDAVAAAARHVGACLTAQRDNADGFGDRGVLLRYEDLCADPDAATRAVQDLVPALDDLDLGRRVAVKGIYDEPLRDMNADQIARLSADDLRTATRVLTPYRDVLRHFGYDLLDA